MEETSETTSNNLAYIVGAVALVLVLGAAFFLRPKGTSTVSPQGTQQAAASPTPGPITGLGCDSQYYNPRIGFNEYYISVGGGDLTKAKSVTCDFTVSVDGETVETRKITSPLTDAPQRGGATFICTTASVELEPNVETIVDVALTDDVGASSSCSATFIFPQQI
jgi:hypothetical protein